VTNFYVEINGMGTATSARSEILMAVVMKIQVCWNMMLCRLVYTGILRPKILGNVGNYEGLLRL
jgi:hypothetical protein